MCYLLFKFIVYSLAFFNLSHNSILLRVRHTNGVLHRLEVHSNTTTTDLHGILKSKGFIDTHDANYTLGSVTYSSLIQQEAILIEDIGINHGEIVRIIQTKTITQTKVNRKSSSIPKKSLKAIDQSSRDKMINIIREKPTNNISIAISLSSGRIMKRIVKGGVGILLGRKIDTKSILNNQKKTKLQTKSLKKVSNEIIIPSQIYEIHSIFELNDMSNEQFSWDIFNNNELLNDILIITKRLNLEILGVCIGGLPNDMNWSTYHLLSLLKLRQYFNDKNLINISISYLKDMKTQTKLKKIKNIQKNKLNLHKNGLNFHLEAYTLSSLINELYEQQILPNYNDYYYLLKDKKISGILYIIFFTIKIYLFLINFLYVYNIR